MERPDPLTPEQARQTLKRAVIAVVQASFSAKIRHRDVILYFNTEGSKSVRVNRTDFGKLLGVMQDAEAKILALGQNPLIAEQKLERIIEAAIESQW